MHDEVVRPGPGMRARWLGKGRGKNDRSSKNGTREQLLATAAELQTMADLIAKYPGRGQLVIAALEDGLTRGRMRVGMLR
jgi:hypothetical protein